MIDFISSWVFNIVTFVILIVLIEIILPSGKTRKFVSLVSGFMLLISIINPLLGLLDKDISFKEVQISDSNFLDKRDIEANSKVLKESQMKQISEVYKKKLIGQMESCVLGVKGISGARAEVVIDEDFNSEHFGEIKKVYLSIQLGGEGNKGIEPVAKVEKIQIDRRDSAEKDGKSGTQEIDGEIKKQIESSINKAFDLSKENIVIALQE